MSSSSTTLLELLMRWLDQVEDQLSPISIREYRRGEVCGLRWTDVDSGSRTLSIQRSVASIPGGMIVKDTKTHEASDREAAGVIGALLDQHR